MVDRLTGDSPKVTVLMPVYNGARFLTEQLSSILAQDGVDLTVLCIDDGSADRSVALLRQVAASDHRVVVRQHPTNQGLLSTVTELLRAVETPFFALSDQDDVWDRDKLQRSIERMRLRGAVLAYSDVRLVDESGRLLDASYWVSGHFRVASALTAVQLVYRSPVLGHTLVGADVVASHIAAATPGLRYYEPLVVAAGLRAGTVIAIEEQLGSYRVHHSNVVGPSTSGILKRSRRAITGLRSRQAHRCAALQELSDVDSCASVLAQALCARGLRRIPAAWRSARVFAEVYAEIGLWRAMREWLLLVCYPKPAATRAPFHEPVAG